MRRLRTNWQALIQTVAFKQLLKLGVMVVTLGFLGWTLYDRWAELGRIDLKKVSVSWLIASTGLTLLGHICNGIAWGAALRALGAKVSATWAVRVYLQTNIAKYTPGKVWHFYGRILAGKTIGIGRGTILLSVLIESVQLAVIASVLGLGLFVFGGKTLQPIQGLTLLAVALVGIVSLKPQILNRGLRQLTRLGKADIPRKKPWRYIHRCYPLTWARSPLL